MGVRKSSPVADLGNLGRFVKRFACGEPISKGWRQWDAATSTWKKIA